MSAILDFRSEEFKLLLIYKSPRCSLPSFKSTGLLVQEWKQKIAFQDGCQGVPVRNDFTPMLPTKFRVNRPVSQSRVLPLANSRIISLIQNEICSVSQITMTDRQTLTKYTTELEDLGKFSCNKQSHFFFMTLLYNAFQLNSVPHPKEDCCCLY